MGQALGYSPQQVRAMSWYDLSCVIDGYERANGVDKTPAPTDEEDEYLRQKYG